MNYQEFSNLKTQVHTGEITAATAMDMLWQVFGGATPFPVEVETKEYSDGTSVTGTPPLPDLSPAQQEAAVDLTEDPIPVLTETIEDFKPKED